MHERACTCVACAGVHTMPVPPSPLPGKTWIDTYGDYTLLNSTTGAKAYMYFQPCGWFGSGRYEARGWCCLAKWCQQLHAAWGGAGHAMLLWSDTGLFPTPQHAIAPSHLVPPRCMLLQISGTINKEDGTPVYKLDGKWNEYLDASELGGGSGQGGFSRAKARRATFRPMLVCSL